MYMKHMDRQNKTQTTGWPLYCSFTLTPGSHDVIIPAKPMKKHFFKRTLWGKNLFRLLKQLETGPSGVFSFQGRGDKYK